MTHKIGVLGLHHDHVWGNLEELQRTGKAELVGAADPHCELLEKYQGLFGGQVFENYDDLLNLEGLTAVYIFGSNKVSEGLTIKAAEKGLHCLVEKPMAASLEGAEKMLAAATENNIRLMINWPFLWWPQLRHAIDLANSGKIGKLWQVRYRAAHQGPVELGCSSYFCEWLYDKELNGAGAMMDYCCYGAVLCQVLLGSPESVHGVGLNTGTKLNFDLEDNAVLILKYPDAMGVTEASWTQIGKLTAYNTTIYGTEGTLYLEPEHGGKIWLATNEDQEGTPQDIPGTPWHFETASNHFLTAIEDPEFKLHPLCDPTICCGAQAILHVGADLMEEA